MTSVAKIVYVDKLNGIIEVYNNAYHRTIKMKPTDAKTSTYIDSEVENNDKEPKFEFNDYVRTSQYKKWLWQKVTPKLVRRSFCV